MRTRYLLMVVVLGVGIAGGYACQHSGSRFPLSLLPEIPSLQKRGDDFYFCFDASPEMGPRVKHAREILLENVDGHIPLSLWQLMELGQIVPTTDGAATLLGKREPFKFRENSTTASSVEADSGGCDLSAPQCMSARFPLWLDGRTGFTEVAFPREIAAKFDGRSDLTIEFDKAIDITLSEGILPTGLNLRKLYKIELSESALRYWIGLDYHNQSLDTYLELRLVDPPCKPKN